MDEKALLVTVSPKKRQEASLLLALRTNPQVSHAILLICNQRASMTFVSKPRLQQRNCPERQLVFGANNLGQRKRFTAFVQSEDGVSTIESLIWLPIYAFILFLVLNVSMAFLAQSQLLRVVQDSNRSFSVGRITTLTAVEQYVIERVAYLGATPSVESQLVDGIIYTDLKMPATVLMPFSMLHKFFAKTTIVVSAQQVVEF